MSIDAAILTSLSGPAGRLPEAAAEKLASMGRLERIDAGTTIMRAGDQATRFHILLAGRLQLLLPHPRPVVIQTLREGDLAGISWFRPPYRWQWDVVSIGPVTTASFDAFEVGTACEADFDFREAIVELVLAEVYQRLGATRLQLIDIYEAVRT